MTETRYEVALKRVNLLIMTGLSVYLIWLVLPLEVKSAVKGRFVRLTALEQSLREHRADLKLMERQVRYDIYSLPEVAP